MTDPLTPRSNRSSKASTTLPYSKTADPANVTGSYFCCDTPTATLAVAADDEVRKPKDIEKIRTVLGSVKQYCKLKGGTIRLKQVQSELEGAKKLLEQCDCDLEEIDEIIRGITKIVEPGALGSFSRKVTFGKGYSAIEEHLITLLQLAKAQKNGLYNLANSFITSIFLEETSDALRNSPLMRRVSSSLPLLQKKAAEDLLVMLATNETKNAKITAATELTDFSSIVNSPLAVTLSPELKFRLLLHHAVWYYDQAMRTAKVANDSKSKDKSIHRLDSMDDVALVGEEFACSLPLHFNTAKIREFWDSYELNGLAATNPTVYIFASTRINADGKLEEVFFLPITFVGALLQTLKAQSQPTV